ncbi:MAG: TadE/TadG family type IV pilus assembly protein [Solirubrobacteraceae bacterium]
MRLRSRLRGEEGTALVEFALVLPVLLLIVMGILYFGRYESYANDEIQLASSGARWAAINANPGSGSSQTLQQYVAAQASPELTNGSSDVSAIKVYIYYPSGSTGQVGQAVRACVTNNLNFIPILGLAKSTMVQTATMSVEQAPSGSSNPWTPDASVPSQCPTN